MKTPECTAPGKHPLCCAFLSPERLHSSVGVKRVSTRAISSVRSSYKRSNAGSTTIGDASNQSFEHPLSREFLYFFLCSTTTPASNAPSARHQNATITWL